MADRCPKCGEVLVTKTIRKELGTGGIEIPVAETCQKCGWSRDLTGAADIKPPAVPVLENVKKEEVKKEEVKRQVIEKPRIVPPPEPQPRPESSGFNKYLTAGLAILVIAGLAWAFFIAPSSPKEPGANIQPTPTPPVSDVVVAGPGPVITAAATVTPAVEVTPTGKSIPVFLDRYRGFIRNEDVTIKPGDGIVWRNTGINTLTLVSSGGLFDAQLLAYDKEYRHIFNNTGSYGFYLKENESLSGTIIVEP